MFDFMLIAAGIIALAGAVIAFDGSRDVFHPLVFIGPMMAFLYAWMPWQLQHSGGLLRYFDDEQLRFVQTLNVLGVFAFVVGCLSAGVRVRKAALAKRHLSLRGCKRLLVAAVVIGSLGLLCWLITIHNVGGLMKAFSTSYAGGWDDSGYVRDGSLLMLVGVMFAVASLSSGGPRVAGILISFLFGLPWITSALFMGRRGPTFAIVVVVLMGWYFNRGKRPAVVTFGLGGLALGWLVLFLVTNRSNLYIGSSFDLSTNVGNVVEKADTGNEFIYGSGTILSTQRRDHYFWMRRYLAQILVRPIPSAVWPTKYEDFGVPELLYNAGTGDGFGDALGWVGAPGSAPGIVADLWVELWWFALLAMGLLGWTYGSVWRKAVSRGGIWSCQYTIMAALSLYMVMQTMEAVIFRTLLLSIPCWAAWRWMESRAPSRTRRRLFVPRTQAYAVRIRASHVPAMSRGGSDV